jgi:hypothetical protein
VSFTWLVAYIVVGQMYVCTQYTTVDLGGVVDESLTLETRFAGLNSAEDHRVLRAIKVSSTTSFGGEVKPSVPCRNVLQHVKEPYE